jgi:hypothetical protein
LAATLDAAALILQAKLRRVLRDLKVKPLLSKKGEPWRWTGKLFKPAWDGGANILVTVIFQRIIYNIEIKRWFSLMAEIFKNQKISLNVKAQLDLFANQIQLKFNQGYAHIESVF